MLSNNDCYKCNFCGLNHELKANGLIINEILSDLINHKPEKVTRGKENEHLEINEFFYKQSIVESTFKCQQCKQANFEYEEARILACGKTVCFKCIQTMTNNNNKFKCDSCLNEHDLPVDTINEIITELIKIKPDEINRGSKVDKLKLNLKNIEFLNNKLEFDYESGMEAIIHDHCTEQKRLIQLVFEEKKNVKKLSEIQIAELDSLHEKLIDSVNLYEKESIKLYSSKKEYKQNIKSIIDKTNKMLAYWYSFTQEYYIYEDEINQIIKLTQISKLELAQELKNIKKEIFNNKMIMFNADDLNIYYEPFQYVINLIFSLLTYI